MADARWDIFFSYARADAPFAAPVIAALSDAGLRVFVDDRDVKEFTSISASLSEALAGSTLLLAFYSRDYPSRRSCNYELTAAFVAGQREGDPSQRIVVVSTAPTFDHVHPIELRDVRSLSLHDYMGREKELAEVIARRVSEVGGVIGTLPQASGTPWYPSPPPTGSSDPQPFRRQLWETHSVLRPGAAVYHTGRWEGGTARVHALDQGTATVFAQDYALQFSAAYPGGIYWLSPGDRDASAPGADSYPERLGALCDLVGLAEGSTELRLSRLAERMEDAGGATLWVVDGFAGGGDQGQLPLFRNPHPRGSTLITEAGTLGSAGAIDISAADERAALELLTAGSAPPVSTVGQEYGATEIIAMLGGHPVALAAARRLLPTTHMPERAYRTVQRALRDPDYDALDFDGEYVRLMEHLAGEFAGLQPDEQACLVWASGFRDYSVAVEEIVKGLVALEGVSPGSARRRSARVLVHAPHRSYTSVDAGRLRVHPLMARAVRYRFAGSDSYERIRSAGPLGDE